MCTSVIVTLPGCFSFIIAHAVSTGEVCVLAQLTLEEHTLTNWPYTSRISFNTVCFLESSEDLLTASEVTIVFICSNEKIQRNRMTKFSQTNKKFKL